MVGERSNRKRKIRNKSHNLVLVNLVRVYKEIPYWHLTTIKIKNSPFLTLLRQKSIRF